MGRASILIAHREQWQRLRKMFNPAFSQAHLETLVPEIVEETLVFANKLREAAENGGTLFLLNTLTVFKTKH